MPTRVDLAKSHALGPMSAPATEAQDERPLIDKHGRRYSQAVLRHWSPAMIKALDIRPITDSQEAKSRARA
jgi:hypothetical protein